MSYQGNYGYTPSPQHSFSQPPHGQHSSDPVQQLSEAFPNIDRATIAAIVTSTKGDTAPAVNALLAISGSGSTSSQLQPPSSQQSAQPQMTALGPPSPAFPSSTSPGPQQSYSSTGSNLYVPPPQYGSGLLSPTPPTPSHITTTNQQTHYSSPATSHSGYVAAQPGPNWQAAASPTIHPYQPLPSVYPTPSVPSRYNPYQTPSSPLPDIGALTLTNPNRGSDRAHLHWASCDGCGQDPIKGLRWNCVKCDDYDLCGSCKDGQVHREHRLEEVPAGIENHPGIYCDGCGVSQRTMMGRRFICQTHKDEDYCQKCVESGRACKGPFIEIRQTGLGRQIEIDGCLPMPDSWKAYLGPETATYNIEATSSEAGWLGYPPGLVFFDVPKRVRKAKAYDAIFAIQTKTSKGHFVSDHKNSWVMKKANGTKVFSYVMETDRKTNLIRQEEFTDASGKSTSPVWRRDQGMDSLTFHNPSSGVRYRWLTNRPISTLNDERFDFQRCALFESRGHREMIVADFAWWDGKEDPEDCLTIRDANIDHALVIASLNVLLDHHWQVMSNEFAREPDNVRKTEAKARLTRLGYASYWLASDYGTDSGSKVSSKQKWETANAALEATNAALSLTSTIIGGGGSGS